jgi:hypothetical protein
MGWSWLVPDEEMWRANSGLSLGRLWKLLVPLESELLLLLFRNIVFFVKCVGAAKFRDVSL